MATPRVSTMIWTAGTDGWQSRGSCDFPGLFEREAQWSGRSGHPDAAGRVLPTDGAVDVADAGNGPAVGSSHRGGPDRSLPDTCCRGSVGTEGQRRERRAGRNVRGTAAATGCRLPLGINHVLLGPGF